MRQWRQVLSVLIAVFVAGVLLAHLTPAPAQVTPGRPQVVNVQHISAVVHIAAAGGPWGVAMALATRCVNTAATAFEACGGSGGGDAVNVFHQSTIRHISSVTHVGGTISLVNQAGTVVTVTGTALDVNCTGCAAASVVAVSHISAAVHIGGTIGGAQFHIQGLGTPGQSHGGVLSIQGIGGGNPVPVTATLGLAVNQQGVWTIQATHQAGRWNIDHVTSVLHIAAAGPVPVVQSSQQALWNVTAHQGTASTTPWLVTAQQGGTWTVQAAHQGGEWNVAHVTSVSHVLGSMQLISQAGVVATFSGTALNVALTGNIAHIQSVMAHVIGTVTVEGRGTAGTATGGVVTIQGVASGTVVAGSANQSGSWTIQAAHQGGQWNVAHVTSVSHVAITAFGSTAVDACKGRAKSFVGITQTAGTQLITGVANQRVYICSLNVVSATAQNLAMVAGTGAVCATATVGVPGLTGGSTAATGWNLAANGGLTFGNGDAALGQTTVNGDSVCLLQSGSGQVSGGLSYVTQ